jgi:hypothetical protein
MSNNVTIKPNANQVEAQGLNRFITVTNNVTGTTIHLTQTNAEIIQVSGPGPAGISGESGTSGTSGTNGTSGTDGTSGSSGTSGTQGPPGTVGINSGVTVGGDIIPDAHLTYDIGSPTQAFKDLYLSSSTIFLGNTKISTDAEGGLTVVASGSDIPLPSNLSGSFTGSYSGSITSTDFTFDGETLNVLGDVFVQGTLDAATKNFKIQHPTMPGYYLVHSSLEGPERGMYVRGKLKTSDTIHLPDYWDDLTDDVDITVQLTPIGNSCTHFVKSVNKQEVIVGCDCGTPHCFYIVHAQRYNEGKFNILQPKRTKSL